MNCIPSVLWDCWFRDSKWTSDL